MKKILLFATAVFMLLGFNNVQAYKFLLESAKYHHVDKPTVWETYTYDDKDRRLTEIHKKFIDDQWIDSALITYTYSDSIDVRLNQLIIEGLWENNRKDVTIYDSTKKVLIRSYHSWKDSIWVMHKRVTYTYDSKGNKLTSLYEDWNMTDGVLEFDDRKVMTYDDYGNELTYLSQIWEKDKWLNYSREIKTYDDNWNKLTYKWESWENNQWIISWKRIYTYDSKGNMLTLYDEDCDSRDSSWDFRRSTYSYDTENYRISFLKEEFIEEEWLTDFYETYTYEKEEKLKIMYTNHFRDDTLYSRSKRTKTYNDNDSLLIGLYEYWEIDEWVNSLREIYSYDINGYQLWEARENWYNNKWNSNTRQIPSYDTEGNYKTILREQWYDSIWVKWNPVWPEDFERTPWYDTGWKIELTWVMPNPVRELPRTSIGIIPYPNPADEFLEIDFSQEMTAATKLKIVNTLGQVYYDQEFLPGQMPGKINTENFPSGSYYLILRSGGRLETKPVIVLH